MPVNFKNPNRNNQSKKVAYTPEYVKHNVVPIPFNENGRVDENLLDVPWGTGARPASPPLGIGNHDQSFQVDGADPDEEELESNFVENEEDVVSSGEFLLLVKGKIISSGDENKIKLEIVSLLNKNIEMSDIVLLKRMEIDFGIIIK